MSWIERAREAQGKSTAPSNVVPIHTRPSVVRTSGDGIHPYAAAIRDAWLSRLDALPRPWVKGAAWDNNCFQTARKLIEVANSAWSGYTLAEARSDYMAHAPADHAWDKREKCWEQAADRAAGVALPEPAPGQGYEIPAVSTLDGTAEEAQPAPDLTTEEADKFWSARPVLSHLHDFARARRVSPWAVLGCSLTRVITATPHQVCLPPIVGGRASLNLFVGLVGPSGSGKGAAESVAAEALQVGHIVTHNVGSGEGIAHGFMHRAKGQLVWNDDEHAVLFSVPEIDSLAAQGDRKGATLMPQLRSGWTGEQLGFGYADPTKRIIVPAHEYRLCLVAGIQPARAGCLLDDADGGTPQRFLWMPATDPDAPDIAPMEPKPVTWEPPPMGGLAAIGGIKVTVCDLASRTIKDNRLARLRGDGDALDGHALLAQLKTAAALALLDGRLDVHEQDWHLAEVIAKKSAATRSQVALTLRAKAQEVNHGRAEAEASRAVHVAEKVTDAAVRRVCGVIVRKLRREGDWISGGELRRSLASGDRQRFETALDRLEETGQVVRETEVEKGVEKHRFRLEEAK